MYVSLTARGNDRVRAQDSRIPFFGRFVEADPLGYADSPNLYAYVLNDPINKVDPLGLQAVEDIGTVTASALRRFELFGPGGLVAMPSAAVSSSPGEGISTIVEHITVTGTRPKAKPKPPARSIVSGLWRDFVRGVRTVICNAPTLGGGAGLDMYAGAGGSISSGASINPQTGQISLGFDLGVGFGLGGGARYVGGKALGLGSASSEVLPVVSGGVNANATAVVGPVGAAGSYQLIGSNPGDWALGYTGGPTATANANLSGHVQANLPPLYDAGCDE